MVSRPSGKAESIVELKRTLPDGSIIEMRVWKLPHALRSDRTATSIHCSTDGPENESSDMTMRGAKAITGTTATEKNLIISTNWTR